MVMGTLNLRQCRQAASRAKTAAPIWENALMALYLGGARMPAVAAMLPASSQQELMAIAGRSHTPLADKILGQVIREDRDAGSTAG